MDFQKASGHLADSKVYILKEVVKHEGDYILAVFATEDAAAMAAEAYGGRKWQYTKSSNVWYEIEEREVLDQAPISKSQGTETPAVGAGPNPQHLPETGA